MLINRVDVVWNYAATFFKIAASSLLLPFILKQMPTETVAIWSVFVTVNALNGIFDFGFNPAFTRNITYIFSGVNRLEKEGFSGVAIQQASTLDYGLLKGTIHAMQWFYTRAAAVYFLLLASFGTAYMFVLLKSYHHSHLEVYVAWALLCSINAFNLYTLYYDSLLQGKGLVKVSKQIVIISQLVYFAIAIAFIMAGKGLIAIVGAQASSVIIVRWLSHKIFFTDSLKKLIGEAVARSRMEIIKAVYPNAVKIGLTTLGGIMVQRSALIIGSLYLALDEVASYGITMQIISIIAGLAGVYTTTYQAKIVQMRVTNNNDGIKKIYIRGQYLLLATFIIGGFCLIVFGNWALDIIGSQTRLLPASLILLALLLSFEQTNLSIAGAILATKNIVPFFKASLISGISIIIALLTTFHFLSASIITMLLIPLLVDFSYQAWKWPLEVIKDLKITFADFLKLGNSK